MTARQFAKLVGFEVVGKLTRVRSNVPGISFWVDEARNEYTKVSGEGWYIITADGGVI